MGVVSKIIEAQLNTYVADSPPTVGITVDTDAYVPDTVMGGLLVFDVASGLGGGFISRFRLVDKDSLGANLRLYVFNALPSVIADDAAFALTEADLQMLVADVPISGFTTVNSIDYWHSDVLNYPYKVTGGKLYAYLVADGSTPNPTNADAYTIYLDGVSEG